MYPKSLDTRFVVAGLVQHKIEWLKAHPMLNAQEIKDYNKRFEEDKNYPVPKNGKASPKGRGIPEAPAWTGGATLPDGWTPVPR